MTDLKIRIVYADSHVETFTVDAAWMLHWNEIPGVMSMTNRSQLVSIIHQLAALMKDATLVKFEIEKEEPE